MTVERIKCTECNRQILPSTAAANGGLCGQCINTPEWIRRECQEFDRQLESGALFIHSQSELKLAACRVGSPPSQLTIEINI
ncbi:MAG: hypothetical protein HC778_06760 [Chamaesiphon sp. CSU_1_12]|nr:hypothetical protein [Chamaesiphon sp. CSU_1_12]